MTRAKMTDIIVSTSAFIVTLTEGVLEVNPIVQSATKDTGLADKFFQIITSDATVHNRRLKSSVLQSFVTLCPKKVFEQFWDSAHWKTLQALVFRIPVITCVLYDMAGDVRKSVTCRTVDVLWALQKIEEAFFSFSLPIKTKRVPLPMLTSAKKDFRRKQNRQTHKYFLHHHR